MPENLCPRPPDSDNDLDAFIELFTRRGYIPCGSGELEPGYLKIAIYEKDGAFHHVAKQLPDGTWSSKIGEAHDIKHDELTALEDSYVFYDNARASRFMKRDYDSASESFELEMIGLMASGQLFAIEMLRGRDSRRLHSRCESQVALRHCHLASRVGP